MLTMMGFETHIALLLPILLASSTSAIPGIAFPINAQVPPVARVSQPFTFTFAPTTFTSADVPSLVYTISDSAPSWLKLDSSTHTFSGTPGSADLGSAVFSLTATDSTGAATTQATLVVVDLPTPAGTGNITALLAQHGSRSSANTLALSTGTAFGISFPSSVFTSLTKPIYYATSADRSPLPSWVVFDATALSFTGTTPPLLSAPQTFGFKLFVSQVVGFSEAEIEFAFEVGSHRLVFQPQEQTISVVTTAVNFKLLMSQLSLDGSPITRQQLASASMQAPQWLNLNSDTLSLTGQAPVGTKSQRVIITATDVYGDHATANVNFQFQAKTQLLSGTIGTINATIGQYFTYLIGSAVVANTDDVVATVKMEDAESWLHFNPTTFTLYGDVPSNAASGIINAVFTVRSKSSGVTQTQDFQIRLESPSTTPSVVQSSSATSVVIVTPVATATSSSTATPSQIARLTHLSALSKGTLAGIIVVSVIPVLLLLIALLFLCRKRRKEHKPCIPNCLVFRKRRGKKPWISRPMVGSSFEEIQRAYQGNETQTRERRYDLEKADSHETNSDPPPRLEADIVGIGQSIRFSKYRDSGGSFLQLHDEAALKDMNRTSFGTDALGIHVPLDSMKVPAQMARGYPETTQAKRNSQRSSGLPFDRRLTGLGHGRMSHGSPTRRPGSLMRRRTRETLSWVSNSSHNMRRQIDSILAPGRGDNAVNVAEPTHAERAWIRMVTPDAAALDQEGVDSRPFAERRKSYIKRRASSMQGNPLFAAHAALSRESSLAKRTPLGKASHNSRRLVQSANFTRSKSSSIGIHRTSGWQRVQESRRSSIRTGDDWESASNYSRDESEDEEEPNRVSAMKEERESRRDKWSHRLGRDGRGEVMDSITERDANGPIEKLNGMRDAQRSRSWTRQTLSPPPLAPRQRLTSTATDASNHWAGAAFL